MSRIRLVSAQLAVVAAIALAARAAFGHDAPRRNVVSAFVRVEGREAHLVIRVPLELAAAARFPAKGRELDLPGAGAAMERALAGLAQGVTLWEEGARLAPATARGRLSLPSDRSFGEYQEAVAHVDRAIEPGTVIYFDQGFLDAHVVYPVRSPRSRFAIQTTLASELGDYVKLAVRFLPAGGDGRAMWITSRSGRVDLDPTWSRAGAAFAGLGVRHILGGFDHLLFLLCLVIPLLRVRDVVATVSAFTVAHSFTLVGSAFGLTPTGAWFPPFVETAIALSIVYMALENIVGADPGRRWLLTGLFGLVHGFGLSYALQASLQFAGRHLLVSLFAFNVGIEIGQLAVLAVALPALALLRRRVLPGRIGVILPSALLANMGWDWMMERGAVLRKVEWPALDAAAAAALAAWIAGLLIAVGVVRAVARRARSVGPAGPLPSSGASPHRARDGVPSADREGRPPGFPSAPRSPSVAGEPAASGPSAGGVAAATRSSAR